MWWEKREEGEKTEKSEREKRKRAWHRRKERKRKIWHAAEQFELTVSDVVLFADAPPSSAALQLPVDHPQEANFEQFDAQRSVLFLNVGFERVNACFVLRIGRGVHT